MQHSCRGRLLPHQSSMVQTLMYAELDMNCVSQASPQGHLSCPHSGDYVLQCLTACKHNDILPLLAPFSLSASARCASARQPSPSGSARRAEAQLRCSLLSLCPPPRVALRRDSLPLRVRLAEPKLSSAERRLVDDEGLEPPTLTV